MFVMAVRRLVERVMGLGGLRGLGWLLLGDEWVFSRMSLLWGSS